MKYIVEYRYNSGRILRSTPLDSIDFVIEDIINRKAREETDAFCRNDGVIAPEDIFCDYTIYRCIEADKSLRDWVRNKIKEDVTCPLF